jgi:hypothetical protein
VVDERVIQGYENLAIAVIKQATVDYAAVENETDSEELDELLEFFAGEWFEELCDMVGTDPKMVRRRLSL